MRMVRPIGNRNISEEAACLRKDEDNCFGFLAASWDIRDVLMVSDDEVDESFTGVSIKSCSGEVEINMEPTSTLYKCGSCSFCRAESMNTLVGTRAPNLGVRSGKQRY